MEAEKSISRPGTQLNQKHITLPCFLGWFPAYIKVFQIFENLKLSMHILPYYVFLLGQGGILPETITSIIIYWHLSKSAGSKQKTTSR